MKGNAYTICFAAILGTVCALLLTGVAEFTEETRERNKVAEKNRNIFTALNIEYDKKASSEELVKIFENNIVTEEIVGEEVDGKKDITTMYKHVEADIIKGVAIAFDGSGLWGPIEGILALEKDKRTIKGITFYQQEETPGIGGDIAMKYFRDRFVGKKIVDSEGKPGIVIKAGLTDPGQNEIDGISGATMTVDKVNDMLNEFIEKVVTE